MPVMCPVFVFENCSAPTMPVKKPTPGESTLKRRSIVERKSLALTGLPSEYVTPLRSVSV